MFKLRNLAVLPDGRVLALHSWESACEMLVFPTMNLFNKAQDEVEKYNRRRGEANANES